MAILFKILGVLGLLLITYGISVRAPVKRSYLFAVGGVLLFLYSAFLRDVIFTILQIIFTLSSVHEIYKNKKAKPEVV